LPSKGCQAKVAKQRIKIDIYIIIHINIKGNGTL
jgi:hypothetical protein